jgi:DNA repair photolyase
MGRRLSFISYQPKTILNKSKRADHWFWTRYSAYPYIGCQHGCEFCYCREQKLSPYDDPNDFAYIVKAKLNAPVLLRKALRRLPVDLVFSGDYQPAERKFDLSRQMLEVLLESHFPVFVLSRSPLVLRDLDLLTAIQADSRAVVAFSVISTPDSTNYSRVCLLEHLAPTAAKRFAAMEKIAAAGILTGTCLMPILPGLCDDPANLEAVVRWTAEHGGQFVLASYLTLSDQQRSYFFAVLQQHFPDLMTLYQKIYPPGVYSPHGERWRTTALRVREYCEKYGIHDRMPRPIIPGDKRTLNKTIVEKLAVQIYHMEIDGAPDARLWAYRKAAWAIEDTEQDLALIYHTMGMKGLQNMRDLSQETALIVERWIREFIDASLKSRGAGI